MHQFMGSYCSFACLAIYHPFIYQSFSKKCHEPRLLLAFSLNCRTLFTNNHNWFVCNLTVFYLHSFTQHFMDGSNSLRRANLCGNCSFPQNFHAWCCQVVARSLIPYIVLRYWLLLTKNQIKTSPASYDIFLHGTS